MLLAHWQYFKRCDLMNFNWNDVGDSALMFLEPYQLKFVKDMVAHVKKKCKRFLNDSIGIYGWVLISS
jgi:hypothetical protein